MNEGVFKEKSMQFAIRIVNLHKYLSSKRSETTISKQLLRSGTAIGALHREAEYAESKKDFIHKLAIAQKECNETLYWIELLYKTDYLDKNEFESLITDGSELMVMLISIIKTTKRNNNTV